MLVCRRGFVVLRLVPMVGLRGIGVLLLGWLVSLFWHASRIECLCLSIRCRVVVRLRVL